MVLQSLTVSDSADISNLQAAAVDLTKVAGSTSVISLSQVEKGRVGTAADVLAYQPGVFAQSAGGTDSLRVSIRGSGINRGQGSFREGITFLFDGLPLTGPGGSPYELFEPLGLEYTEILRGANGFKYGGLALGGVINYVTKTGYDSSPFEGRLELGSYGYKKAQIASGQVVGNADYYATVIGSERLGFQDLTSSHSARFIANFGYKFNENISNRVYIRYGATTFENPGNLTVAQIKTDPTQANPNAVNNAKNPLYKSVRVQQGSTWIGDKLTVKIEGDSTLDLGVVFHDYPIDIQGTTANLGGLNYLNTTPGLSLGGIRSLWWHDDVTVFSKYTYNGDVFGRHSVSEIGLLSTTELIGTVKTYTDNSTTVATQTRKYAGSGNHVLFASNDLELAPKFWSSLAAQLIYINRQSEYTYINPTGFTGGPPSKYSRDVVRLAPRFGLRYDVTPDVQIFGNVSHSVEPADSWKYNAITTSNTLPQKWVGWGNLKEQQSTTVEIGTRAKVGRFDGGLTLYHSWLKDELLTSVNPAAPTTTTNFNASNTVHQGVELSLNTLLWQEGGIDAKPVKGGQLDKLSFRQAYTISDFHYVNDGASTSANLNNSKNELPGLPPQFYQGELLFEHSSGLYVGVNAQISSSYWVDYKNTWAAPSYTIFGAKIGYAPPKGKWELNLDFKNLTNEHYVTAASPTFNAKGIDGAYFQPGDGFSVFGSFSYKY